MRKLLFKIFIGLNLFLILFVLLSDLPIKKSDTNNRRKISKTDRLIMQAEWEFMKTRDPQTNSIPDNIKSREINFISSIPTKESYYSQNKSNYDYTFANLEWRSRGPANVAGRILSIAFDKNNEKIILAGSASGGLWRTIDDGQSWVKTNPPNYVQSVTCVIQDKRIAKNQTWYYGTGELLSTTDRRLSIFARTIGIGDGIFKSTDNGSSWEPIPSTRGAFAGALTDVFQGVWNIAIDNNRTNGSLMYAACYGAIMKSTDEGNSWEKAIGDLSNKAFCTDIIITDDGTAYAALSTLTTTGTKPQFTGIYRSDDGTNWTNITPNNFTKDYRTIKLALAPSNQNVLYVITETSMYNSGVNAFPYSSHSLWKYTNGAGIWENKTANLPGGGVRNDNIYGFVSLGGYALKLKVKPDDENVVLLGGTSLYRTTNAFTDTLHNKNIGGYPYDFTLRMLHPDIHDIQFLPSNPNIVYVASDGGIHYSDNYMTGSVEWQHINNNLLTTQFYSISMNHVIANDKLLFGGLQDNASQITNSDNPADPWDIVYGGDGMSSAVANDKTFVVGSVYYGYFYTLNSNGTYIDQLSDKLNQESFAFYTNFIIDPDSSNTLFLAQNARVWRKNNLHESAFNRNKVNSDWSEVSKEIIDPNYIVSALAIAKAPASRLFFGANNGKLYKLDNAINGSGTPAEITGDYFPKNGFVSCIEVDSHNPNNLFTVFSNYNVQSIFYSTDGGASWFPQGGNLEENPDGSGAGPSIRWIKIVHAGDMTMYFAGTSAGLFSTTKLDGMKTAWLQEGANNIGNVIIEMIDYREVDGLIAVATQGNGVYCTNIEPFNSVDENSNNYLLLEQNYPNPTRNETTINFSIPTDCFVNLNLYDINGNLVRKIINQKINAGKHANNFITNPLNNGSYFYRLETPYGIQTKKMIVDR